MCEICKDIDIILRNSFYSPRDYLNCLHYIEELVDSGAFILESGTCALDKVTNERTGCWVDDIITHVICCKACGQAFTCSCDTYHGRGGFRKGR